MLHFSQSTSGFYDSAIHGAAIPADTVEITADEHAALLAGQSAGLRIVADANGRPVLAEPPPPSAEQTVAALTAAVQEHLDAAASAVGYDNIYTACTYADEPSVPKFQAEGQALRAWRSEVWAKCHEIMSDVRAGNRETPSAYGLIGELPELVLP